jgi:hypothetical protein
MGVWFLILGFSRQFDTQARQAFHNSQSWPHTHKFDFIIAIYTFTRWDPFLHLKSKVLLNSDSLKCLLESKSGNHFRRVVAQSNSLRMICLRFLIFVKVNQIKLNVAWSWPVRRGCSCRNCNFVIKVKAFKWIEYKIELRFAENRICWVDCINEFGWFSQSPESRL